MNRVLPLLASLVMGLATPVFAQDIPSQGQHNVFGMGGIFTDGHFGETFQFWRDHYESNFFGGVGYQYFLYDQSSLLNLGFEAGLGVRAGDSLSAEAWGGGVLKANIPLGDFRVSPALTLGYSLVTDTIGVESVRAANIDQAVPVLFYLGPEIAVSNVNHPEWEAFARVHHRSGGYGTIGHIDGSNALNLGLRYKF